MVNKEHFFIFQFTKKPLVDAYTAFIRNVKRADDAIKIARTTKPAFDRFLQVTKQNKKFHVHQCQAQKTT